MSTPTEQGVAEYFAAIRAMDVERCVAVFAPEAEQHDPVGTPVNVGHEAIRAFFTGIFTGFKTVGLTEDLVFVNGNSAAAKWTGKGIAHNGKSATFEGIDVLDFNEDGKIVQARAFWDPAPVMDAIAD
ncbi:ketosteroid isomerase-like protein [Terriglobus roseus DSM 18391]|uniref:Ketosteroid isomerase-like protein n=1 Tax=Terriglobus roseus (strain DSM 18391 / NRRL B-41598 / KBS 63) TaxID=926566 RepID=I3ZDU3_TERRK|nr:nuclear transport factor 2 family protein [Terriglobus roseus]AFL87411.1 ketosteroid isomerase-like protein [Terriglobus roseus DSM 18391]